MVKRRGLLIARHRRQVLIEDDAGAIAEGLVLGRRLKPLAGDEVLWHTQPDGTSVIDEILPRRSVLERIDNRGRAEGVAANVSLVAVVVAPEPAPDWQLVDRYLVAAEIGGVQSALVRNKQDVDDAVLDARYGTYADIVHACVRCSARTGFGIDELGAILAGERAVFVGQSGVGKSSLTNALLRDARQAVSDLSQKRSLGKHTTTAAVLHHLPGGGDLIDSPGVRRYAPKLSDPRELEAGFVEFRKIPGHCRFNDCRHDNEPGCAIKRAVDTGAISADRYASYLKLRDALESLRDT